MITREFKELMGGTEFFYCGSKYIKLNFETAVSRTRSGFCQHKGCGFPVENTVDPLGFFCHFHRDSEVELEEPK